MCNCTALAEDSGTLKAVLDGNGPMSVFVPFDGSLVGRFASERGWWAGLFVLMVSLLSPVLIP